MNHSFLLPTKHLFIYLVLPRPVFKPIQPELNSSVLGTLRFPLLLPSMAFRLRDSCPSVRFQLAVHSRNCVGNCVDHCVDQPLAPCSSSSIAQLVPAAKKPSIGNL